MSKDGSNAAKSISELQPGIHEALQRAGYLKGSTQLPKLGTILSNRQREMMEAEIRKEERKASKNCNIYIMKSYDGMWRMPVHKSIGLLIRKYGLSTEENARRAASSTTSRVAAGAISTSAKCRDR